MTTNLSYKITSRNEFEYFFKFTKLSQNFDKLWRMKSLARESVKEWLIANDVAPTTSEDTANSCSELIENSIKYSMEKEESLVLIGINKPVITIETLNKSEVDQKEKLLTFVNEILTSSKKITEIYLEKVQKSVLSGESQLGIVKIIMETKGDIKLIEHEENDIVHVKVTINV